MNRVWIILLVFILLISACNGNGPVEPTPTPVPKLSAGTILVALENALISIDPQTGNRTVISNFEDSSLGTSVESPMDIATDAEGNILVVTVAGGTTVYPGDDPVDNPDPRAGGVLIRIDPDTGQRQQVSDFGDPSQVNPEWVSDPVTAIGGGPIAVDFYRPTGEILALDELAGTRPFEDSSMYQGYHIDTFGIGTLYAINPSTGYRTVMSDFGTHRHGVAGFHPSDVTVAPSTQNFANRILVIDSYAGAVKDPSTIPPGQSEDTTVPRNGILFSIDPTIREHCNFYNLDQNRGECQPGTQGYQATRTTLSNLQLGLQGPNVSGCEGPMTHDYSGENQGGGNILLICDQGLYAVNPMNGVRTLIMDLTDDFPRLTMPKSIGVEPDGDILIADWITFPTVEDMSADTYNPTSTVVRIDPQTGDRTILTDFGDSSQGFTTTGVDGSSIGVPKALYVTPTDTDFHPASMLANYIDSATGTDVLAFTNFVVVSGRVTPTEFVDLTAISDADVPAGLPTDVTFPYGFFTWKIVGIDNGKKNYIHIAFPDLVEAPATYWFHADGAWNEISALTVPDSEQIKISDDDGDNVLILLIDEGSIADVDGVANGELVLLGGLGVPNP